MNCFITNYYTPDVKDELKQIFAVAWPLIIASLWSYLMSPVSLMFCGHLGTTVLDGVSIAGSVITIFGVSVVTGLSAACDTFFAQTYGFGNFSQLAIYLQRSILIIGLSLLPCWTFLINSRAFLALIGQDPAVSNVASDYLDKFLFGLPGCFAFVLLSKYLQTQDILYPTVVIGAIGNGLSALLHYLLIWVAGMGYDGSAYAQAISFNVMGLLSAGYIYFWKIYDKDWPGWGHQCLSEWSPFMRLAIPGFIMICVESWSIEIGVFIAGVVGVVGQSAESILFQVQTITDMFTIGLGTASSIRIGQHLGRGNPDKAKLSAFLCLLVTSVIAVVTAALLVGLRSFIPLIFSDETNVNEIVSNLLPVVGIGFIADALAATSGGIIRGCGRQVAGSVINIVGYYVIALPVGISLTVYLKIIDPLWYGLYGALTIMAVIFCILILKTNWVNQARLAAERCNLDKENNDGNKVSSLIASFAGRRTTWATLSGGGSVTYSDRRNRKKATNPAENQKNGLIVATFSHQGDDDVGSSISIESETTPLLLAKYDDEATNDSISLLLLTKQKLRRLVVKRIFLVVFCLSLFIASLVLRFTIFANFTEIIITTSTTTHLPMNGSNQSTSEWFFR